MKIEKIAVLGTGTMGPSMAILSAQAGFDVIMYGRSDESLERGFNNIKDSLNRLKLGGQIAEGKCEEILGKVRGVKTIEEAAKEADFVLECLAEELKLKQDVFEKLDKVCPPEVILATITSGLSPTEISKNMKHPERIVVAQVWNPAHLVPLIEVIPGGRTSKETMDRTIEWVESIGKKPVSMKKECPGFIGNRLQFALLREALYIVEQGWATAEEVDKAMEYGLGRRLPATGPLISADLGGLDVFSHISEYLFKDLCNSTELPKLLKSKVEAGKLGVKTGEGFYKWTPDFLEKKQRERQEVLTYLLEKDSEEK